MHFDFFEPFYLLRLLRGEELITSLKNFAKKENIPAGLLWGIGAMEEVEIGYFDDKKKDYIRKKFRKSVEILSLQGSISWIENKPYIHIHCVIGDQNLKCFGGHFFKGKITATAEIYIYKLKKKIFRIKDEKEPFYFLNLKKNYIKE